MDLVGLDSYDELVNLNTKGELNEEIVYRIVREAKLRNILGNEVLLQVNTVVKLKDEFQYFVNVLKAGKGLSFCKHPINKQNNWEISFKSTEEFKKNDLLSSKYTSAKKEELIDLIKPISDSIKLISSTNDLRNKYGNEFVNTITNYIKGPKNILPVIYDFVKEKHEDKVAQYDKIVEEKKKECEIAKIKEVDIKAKLNQLEKELKEINREKIKIELEYEKRKSDLEKEIEKELENKKNLIKEIDLQIRKKERIRITEADKINTLQDKLHNLEICFGFRESMPLTIGNKTNTFKVEDGDDIYKLIQRALYHHNNENLIYTENIIKSFYRALLTDQLVLLSGPSGTGKSSLINQFGKVVENCKVHHIAVQSSWTDVEDLIGFFNPVQQRYVPTPFLDALLEARLNPDKIHIICLDEMNLAHIEYYFSSILSIREKNRDERYLDLYSERFFLDAKKNIEESIGRNLEHLSQMLDEDIEYLYEEIKRKSKKKSKEEKSYDRNSFELTFYYPSKFIIPQNVRFVGTLNMDETVKSISPKVIDRSFVIELDNPSNHSELRIDLEKNKFDNTLIIDVDKFINFSNYKLGEDNSIDKEINQITAYTQILDKIPNANLNSRGKTHIGNYMKIDKKYDNEIINQIIYYKVLPRIKFSKSNEDYLRFYNDFIDSLPEGIAKEKAIKMKSSGRVIQFWEN